MSARLAMPILWVLGTALTCSAPALARAGEEERVVFRFDPSGPRAALGDDRPEPIRVTVAGEFNGWDEGAWPLARGDDGVFRREADLAAGVYRYKLLVDGEWLADPANPLREPSGHRNSVLVVGAATPVPDLSARRAAPARSGPKPRRARPGAFVTVPAEALGDPLGLLPRRPLYVYLPPSYAAAAERRYPVIYLQDGQNVWSDPTCCFGHGGWALDATVDRLVAAGQLEEVILVGVPNSPARMREYGTAHLLRAGEAAYGRYLSDVGKPYVDERFRTRPGPEHTALMGSSLGGLVSFALAFALPDVFGAAACLSPSFWFEDGGGETAFDLLAARGKQPLRLYIDSGTAGPSQDGAPRTRAMAAALRRAGWRPGDDLLHHEEPGGRHDESAWRARAERPLRFLFGR